MKTHFEKLCTLLGYLCITFQLIAFSWQEKKVLAMLHLFLLKAVIAGKM